MHENIELIVLPNTEFTREVLKSVERLDSDVHVLLAGGNLGDPVENLRKALELLKDRLPCQLVVSACYKTAAWGFESDDFFVNQAWIVKSDIDVLELLAILQKIEQDLGRETKQSEVYESRTMDIDIIFSAQRILEEEQIIVPHPRMQLRKFVLEPLNELIPNYIHPILKLKIKELNKALSDDIERLSSNF